MSDLANFSLGQAAEAFSVANTPLFLLRKLREDSEVRDIGLSVSAEEILREIETSLSSEVKNLRDEVTPYVCVVALSRKNTDSYLKVAAESPHLHRRDWLKYILQVLTQTYSPTSTQNIFVPGQLLNVSLAAQGGVDAGETRTTIDLNNKS